MYINERKESFNRIIRCLAHPAAILSMALLFLNDYVFRIASPSWVTGKLGDFGWLFFFPYFLTAILVWVLPKRWLKKDTPILIGIGLTAVIFSLGKTTPFFLQFIIDSLEAIFPWRVGWVVDPTDLIALPMLLLTYLLWVKLPDSQPVTQNKVSWLWLGAAAFVLLGDAAAPTSGARCVSIMDDHLIAYVDMYNYYESDDGGMTWIVLSEIADDSLFPELCLDTAKSEYIISNPENAQEQFRFVEDTVIEYSTDNGQNWIEEYSLYPKSEAEESYFAARYTGFHDYLGMLPHNAVIDPSTGNLVMAMGLEGVLVRDTDGEYHHVAVGEYSFEELTLKGIFSLIVPAEFLLSIFLASICAGIFNWGKMKVYQKSMLGLLWVGTFLYGVELQPAYRFPSAGYDALIYLVVWIILGILSLAVYIFTFSQVRPVLPVIITTAVVPVLYLIPLFFWGFNILPYYHLAFGLGVSLSAGWTVYRFIQYRKLDEDRDIEPEVVQP